MPDHRRVAFIGIGWWTIRHRALRRALEHTTIIEASHA